MKRLTPTGALMLLCAGGCLSIGNADAVSADVPVDGYSYANTNQFRATHFALSLEVDFRAQQLQGGIALELQRLDLSATQVVLDTQDLTILSVTELSSDIVGATEKPEPIWISRPFHLGKANRILGRPLIIELPASRQPKLVLRIDYETAPQARGLQWSGPTPGNPHQSPFLYTLSAPINARSWIPLQDTPRVRATYSAHIHTPDNQVALMAAKPDRRGKHPSEYWFVMDQAVPAQDIALVAGDLRYKATGARSGVWAEKSAVAAAAKLFADTEPMLKAAEKLLGAYPWDRFDIAAMPMSFPLSEVAYADLATISPTLLAADKSQLAPLAYAVAYAGSGALVAPAEWRDRWIGEAIASYLARRILTEVHGAGPEDPAADAADEGVLAADLSERAYDDIFNQSPRRKGRLLFVSLGEKYGTARIDALLRTFLDRYAGQSVSTAQFVSFIQENLPQATLSAWLFEAGVPAGAEPAPPSVQADVTALASGDIKALQVSVRAWSGAHWVRVLDAAPSSIGAARLAELDRTFKLSANPNAEITASWFGLALRAGDTAVMWPLQNFLLTTGRLALIEPLYEQMMQTEEASTVARRVYALARHVYHPFVARRLDEIIKP